MRSTDTVTISLPAELADPADRLARQGGRTRSALFREGLRQCAERCRRCYRTFTYGEARLGRPPHPRAARRRGETAPPVSPLSTRWVRLVLDTNVLVSVIHFGGRPLRLLGTALRDEHRLVIRSANLDELGAILLEGCGWSSDRTRAACG